MMETDGREWAMAHTNLGLHLLERPHAESDGSLEAAIGHFEQALRWRSFERDPADWAYTQVNLALAYARRSTGDRPADLRRAVHHGSEAERGFAAANDAPHGAQALANRAIAQTDLALLDGTAADERALLLERARHDARAAIAMLGDNAAGVDAGRRWAQLGRVLAAEEAYTAELVEVHQRALTELTPRTAPANAAIRPGGWLRLRVKPTTGKVQRRRGNRRLLRALRRSRRVQPATADLRRCMTTLTCSAGLPTRWCGLASRSARWRSLSWGAVAN